MNKKKPMFVFTGLHTKVYCPVENCPFKSARKVCLFYFEYKDGSVTCANSKELSKAQRKKSLEQTISKCEK